MRRVQTKPIQKNRRWWAAAAMGGVILMVVGVGWRISRFESSPKPPMIDLRSLETNAAQTIQQRLIAVQQQPRSSEAWGWLGALLRVYEFRPQARECLTRAEQLNPKDPRWPYFHGLVLVSTSPLEAIVQFRRAADLCGTDPEIPRIRLVRLLAEQGRWDEAQTALEPLFLAKPDFAPARLLHARVVQARDDLPRAIELAQGCTNDVHTARSAWALLALLYRQQGKTEAATHAAQLSTTLPTEPGLSDPFEEELLRLRGDPRSLSEPAHPLLAQGRINEAIPLINRLVKEHPTFPDTWLLCGRLQLLRKDYIAAERALRHHLELNPQSVQGLFQLGLTLLEQKRFSDAAAVFAQATQLKPDFGPGHYNRGYALARSGQPREAITAFRESLRNNPERADTYFLLADLHLQLGEKEAALTLLNQAQALNPKDPRLTILRNRVSRSKPEKNF